MAGVKVRLQPVSRDLDLVLRQDLSPEARKRFVQDVALRELRSAQEQNRAVMGAVPPHETIIDGRRGADLSTINPDRGVIVFEFEMLGEVVDWCWTALFKASPVLTGRYSRSHRIFADGDELEAPDPARLAKEWRIASNLPYARRIERGWSDQAPDGVYQAVSALAQRRFGNFARVRFGFTAITGGDTMLEGWAGRTGQGSRIKNPARRAEWLRRQPALVITLR